MYLTTTTIAAQGLHRIDGLSVVFVPASLYCYVTGQDGVEARAQQAGTWIKSQG